MDDELKRWLSRHRLDEYAPVLEEHRIDDLAMLRALDRSERAELIVPLGDRKRLEWALAESAHGAPQAPPGGPAPAPPSLQLARGFRRKQLTVMFVDLVGSTRLAQQLDPEDFGEFLEAWFDCCTRVTRDDYGGEIEGGDRGDGFRVLFGEPEASESDAERAVAAGLDVIASVSRLRVNGRKAQVHVGIATGLTLVGPGAHGRKCAYGEPAHIAAWLQKAAGPDSILMAGSTRRLVGNLFELEDCGEQQVGNSDLRVRAWRVLGRTAHENRFEATRGAWSLTPLIGRELELDALRRHWGDAVGGNGQVVLVTGDSGIGKSRLVENFTSTLEVGPARVLRFYCSPYHGTSTLYPVIQHIRREAGLRDQDPPQQQAEKLFAVMSSREELDPVTAHALLKLFSIRLENGAPPHPASPGWQRELTFRAFERYLRRASAYTPVLAIIEDLHWADHTTLELLERCVVQMTGRSAMLVATFRDGEMPKPVWASEASVRSLQLKRLSPAKCAAMLRELAGQKKLHDETVAAILQACDGVPFFLEELFRSVVDSDASQVRDGGDDAAGYGPPLDIPSTLQELLTARLDRLGDHKVVAQIGAVIGREFTRELLAKVSGIDEYELARALRRLADESIVVRRPHAERETYFFRHALMQQAALSGLLHTHRRDIHARIGAVVEEDHPEIVDAEPEMLARHFEEAGLARKAIEYWGRAGRTALERCANRESVLRLNRALELLPALEDERARARAELDLRLSLGSALLMREGHDSPAVAAAYARARELCEDVGDEHKLLEATAGLARCYLSHAAYPRVWDLGWQGVQLAGRLGDDALLEEGHLMLGACLFYQGKQNAAQEHLEHAWELLSRRRGCDESVNRPTDPRVMCLAFRSWNLWNLGRPDSARRSGEQALSLARSVGHPYGLGFALFFAAVLQHRLRNVDAAREHAQEAIEVSEGPGFARWLAGGRILLGWTMASDGQHEQALATIERGLSWWRDNSRQGLPHLQALLAEVYVEIGDFGRAVATLRDSLSLVERTGEHRYEPEIWRLLGETSARAADAGVPGVSPGDVEPHLRRAIAVARAQGARSLELRAAVSLGTHLARTDPHADVAGVLAAPLRWFEQAGEGLDTPEYRLGRSMLTDVRGASRH